MDMPEHLKERFFISDADHYAALPLDRDGYRPHSRCSWSAIPQWAQQLIIMLSIMDLGERKEVAITHENHVGKHFPTGGIWVRKKQVISRDNN